VEGPFRRSLPSAFRLIETLGWRPDVGFAHLPLHLARLERTARRFDAPFERQTIDAALAVARGYHPLRVRLTLALDGTAHAATSRLAPDPEVWTLRIASARLDPDDPWLGVKTTERALYDDARGRLPAGIDEMLFLNARGEICEGAITNVFLDADGVFLTPSRTCGLLPGVFRENLLVSGRAREAILRPADLDRGRLFVGNALRGLRPARLD